MMKRKTSLSVGRAGYSVVEMAIVLAVLGLLLGSVLLPLSARFKGEQLQATREQLERIENAVLSYAIRNSTKPAQALLAGQGTATAIPGGRPYLPCPDISGDGHEDRYSQISDLVSDSSFPLTQQALTLTLGDSLPTLLERSQPVSFALTVTLDTARASNRLVTADSTNNTPGLGACASDKGSIPWATLGVPPADVWGNRITYRVDPFFANSVIGFGHETRSDPFDTRMPLTATVSSGVPLTVYQRRYFDDYVQSSHPGDFPANLHYELYIDESPGVVCKAFSTRFGCSPYYEPSSNLTVELLNEASSSDITLFDVYPNITIARLYEQEDIMNGMAFVLVSHGFNQFGAIAHEALQIFTPYCRDITTDLSDPETENADFRNLCTIDRFDEFTKDTPSSAAHSGVRSHSFVSLPHNRKDVDFDDVLRFMSGAELIARLAGLGRKFGGPWIPPGPTP